MKKESKEQNLPGSRELACKGPEAGVGLQRPCGGGWGVVCACCVAALCLEQSEGIGTVDRPPTCK